MRRLLAHIQSNGVAYVALMIAVAGSGGSYAVAATSHHSGRRHPATTLAACVNDRTGEVDLRVGGRERGG
jgi:hypothetical protein